MGIVDKTAAAYAAMKARFHGGNVHGQPYKQLPEYHSLGARGGKRDGNGNLLGPDGKVIGRLQAFYGAPNSGINPWTNRSFGSWMRGSDPNGPIRY
jgi:hypothetical protein